MRGIESKLESDFESHDELLARYLESHECACPHCGYSLRRLRTTRCPECGAGLELTIGTTRRDLRLFISGLVALSSAFGFAAILLLPLIGLMFVFVTAPSMVHLLLIVMAVIAGSLTLVWCNLSAWFPRQRPRVQVALVIGAWCVPFSFLLVSFIVFWLTI